MKNIKESLIKHFDNMETIKDYDGHFYCITELVIIAILGTFCALKSLKQIQQWAIDERIRVFLEEHFKITEIPSYSWESGQIAAIKTKEELAADKRFAHINISINPPSKNKDYNNTLLQAVRQEREQKQNSSQRDTDVLL